MPRGHPDWQVNTEQFSFGDLDTAEAMVRIGSPASISRSGRVVWLTGFENDLHEISNLGMGTGVVVRDTTYPFRGSACAKLTGEDGAGLYATVAKRIPFLTLGRIGLEFAAWFFDGDGLLEIALEAQNSDVGFQFWFDLYAAGGDVHLWDDVAGDVLLGNLGGGLDADTPIYLDVKVVVDALTGRYVYIRVNDLVFDGSAYTADGLAPAFPGRYTLWLYHNTEGTDPSVLYLDDLIFTIDEP
jgi:hypothetical protein